MILGREDCKGNKKIIKGNSKHPRQIELLDESFIDNNIKFALNCLFRNTRYLPSDPYKTIISILRRQERIEDLPTRIAYNDIPKPKQFRERIESLILQRFKKSKCATIQHNHQILTNETIIYAESIVQLLREKLGNLPIETKKGTMESYFIEVLLNCGGNDGTSIKSLLSPRPNILEINVEGLFFGPNLDDCLLSFIRRVFEELDAAKKTKDLICSNCRVIEMNGNISVFNLEDIRNHKQLVLTTIKSATIEGGEILLELYLKISRILPSNLCFPDHAHLLSTESSTGFIQIIRKYNFTYIDSTTIDPDNFGINTNSNGTTSTKSTSIKLTSNTTNPTSNLNSNSMSSSTSTSTPTAIKNDYFKKLSPSISPNLLIRSFSQYPIDSLLRGVFLSIDEGEKFRLICIRFSNALEKTSSQNKKQTSNSNQFSFLRGNRSELNNDDSIYLKSEEILLTRMLNHYCKNIIESLEKGEFVQSGRYMLNLQSLLTFTQDEVFNNNTILSNNNNNNNSHRRLKNRVQVSLYDKSSYCIKQIASLSGQTIGKLFSVREIIESYISCIRLFINDYVETCPYFNETNTSSEINVKKKKKQSITIESSIDSPTLKRENIFYQYDSIRLALLEIKNIIYGIYRDRYAYNSSELMIGSDELISLIDSLFNENHTMNCILPSIQLLKRSNLGNIPVEMIKSLKVIIEPLSRISHGLHFLICSLGGEILMELLQMDLDSKYNYNIIQINQSPYINETQFMLSRPPLTFTELIGYCQARILGKLSIDGHILIYKPYQPGSFTRYLLDRNSYGYGNDDEDIKAKNFYNLNLLDYLSYEESVVTQNTLTKGFDIFEIIAGLSMSWIGRLSTIDILRCHKDEIKQYREFPSFISFEGVKLRYIMETKLESSLLEGYFEACLAPELFNVYSTLSLTLSKTSSFLQLWNYNDDEIINNISKFKDENTSKFSYRIQNSKTYGFSKILIESLDTKGGIYGPKIMLQHLCKDWDTIFTNIWCIPPFLPKIPSQGSNGITAEVISGLSLETCLKWGISSLNSIYTPKKKSKKPKTKDKPFEKLVIEPLKNEIYDHLPYEHSDDENDEDEDNSDDDSNQNKVEENNNNNNNNNNENSNRSRKDIKNRNIIENKFKKYSIPQDYPWNVTSLGRIQLEVVYKYSHDIPSQIDEIYNLFTTEIEYIIQYMNTTINWSINQIRVPISPISSPDDQKVLIYPISRLKTGDENLKQNFRKRVNKVGLCWIDAAVLLVDPSNKTQSNEKNIYVNSKSNIIKFEQLINLFNNNNNNNNNQNNNTSNLNTTNNTNTINQQFLRSDINNSSPRSGVSVDRKFVNDSLGSEIERIVDGLSGSYEIKRLLQSQVKIYVPITLRINLLATIRGLDIPSAASEKITSRNIPLLSNEVKKLTIGRSETIARLISSTLWFTEEGALQIWSCAKQTQSIINCYNYESKRHLLYSKQFYTKLYYTEAYERLCLSVLISKQILQVLGTIKPITREFSNSSYLKLTTSEVISLMLRMIHGLPGLINDVLQSISIIKFLFQTEITSDGVGYNSISTLGFAFTIVRHISYKIRLILMSSQCVHYQCGSYLILLKLKELETILHLGQLRLFNLKSGTESSKILSSSKKKFKGYVNTLPSTLPIYIPSSDLIDSTKINTELNTKYSKNPEFEFSQSLFSADVVVRNIPTTILGEIESYLRYLSIAHSKDVNKNILQLNENVSNIFNYSEIDLSLELLIHEIMLPKLNSEQIPQEQTISKLSKIQQPIVDNLQEEKRLASIMSTTTGTNSRRLNDTSSSELSDIERELDNDLDIIRSNNNSNGNNNNNTYNSNNDNNENKTNDIYPVGLRRDSLSPEERLLSGVSSSSVISINEADFLTPGISMNSLPPYESNNQALSGNNSGINIERVRNLNHEDLEDREIALSFHRNRVKLAKNVNMYVVNHHRNYLENHHNGNNNDKDDVSIRDSLNSWEKIKRVGKRVSVLESLRKR